MSARDKIHIKRFMGGRKTPQQAHREMTYQGKRCTGCKGPPAIRICVFYPVAEVSRALVNMLALQAKAAGEPPPFIRFNERYGNQPFLMVSDVYACETCAPTAERAAARGPSYAVVHIDRGPDPTNKVVFGGFSPGGVLVIPKG